MKNLLMEYPIGTVYSIEAHRLQSKMWSVMCMQINRLNWKSKEMQFWRCCRAIARNLHPKWRCLEKCRNHQTRRNKLSSIVLSWLNSKTYNPKSSHWWTSEWSYNFYTINILVISFSIRCI
jgi:hypothetical protein